MIEYIKREDALSLKKPFPNQKDMVTLYRQYKVEEEKGYIMTPPDSGINVYIIDKNGDIIKSNISKTSNIKDFFFDYAISIDNTTM